MQAVPLIRHIWFVACIALLLYRPRSTSHRRLLLWDVGCSWPADNLHRSSQSSSPAKSTFAWIALKNRRRVGFNELLVHYGMSSHVTSPTHNRGSLLYRSWSSLVVIRGGHHWWSSDVVIARGHHSWSSLVVITRGHQPWSSLVVIAHNSWSSLVIISRGHRSWSSLVVITRDHQSWSSLVVITRGHHSWSSLVVTRGSSLVMTNQHRKSTSSTSTFPVTCCWRGSLGSSNRRRFTG